MLSAGIHFEIRNVNTGCFAIRIRELYTKKSRETKKSLMGEDCPLSEKRRLQMADYTHRKAQIRAAVEFELNGKDERASVILDA